MSKFPMSWHRECYQNASANAYRLRRDVERLTAELAERERELAFYAEQIAVAEKRGLEAFDPDRLLVKPLGGTMRTCDADAEL